MDAECRKKKRKLVSTHPYHEGVLTLNSQVCYITNVKSSSILDGVDSFSNEYHSNLKGAMPVDLRAKRARDVTVK